MNSRERLLRAINHQEPDRVPIDLGSTIVTGISAPKYHELKNHLSLSGHPTRIYDVYLMLAQPHLEVLDRLHVDTVMLPWLMRRDRWGVRLDKWRSWTHPRGIEVIIPDNFRPQVTAAGDLEMLSEGTPFARMPKEGYYFDYIESQRAVGDQLPDTEAARYNLLTDEELTFIQATARSLFENTDKGLVGDGGGTDLDIIGSYDEWLMLLAAEPDYMTEFYTKRVESIIANLEVYAQAVKDYIQVIFFGQDFGMQDRELVSPRMFKRMIAPHYKKVFDWIHANTAWKVMFHSDGSIYNLLPQIIEMGVDILNPVQCTAVNMEAERLKAEFGQELVFWGAGVDTQTVLPAANVDVVKDQVQERIAVFAPGGGYVFSAVHNIQEDVPVENIVAAFETAYQAGQYSP